MQVVGPAKTEAAALVLLVLVEGVVTMQLIFGDAPQKIKLLFYE